jgi:hypothetical protein
MMMKKQTLLFVLLFSAILIGMISCGIYSFSGASLSPEVKTVTIRTFTNQASIVFPSLAEKITEKLKDKFMREMNLKLVDDNGDVLFRGSVVDYKVAPASIGSNDQSKTSRLTISVKVKFENTKEPKGDFESVFSSYMDFDSSKDLTQVENELVEGITDILVQDIFNKAVNNW